MKSLFSLDNPIMIFLGKMADMMILNLLFVFCSIPVVTIGAAATAMCYVTLKARDGYEGSVFRHFFKSFKQNFLQATLIWLFLLFCAVILWINYSLARAGAGGGYQVIRLVIYIAALILGMTAMYVFFLQARFHNTVTQTLRNALMLALGNAPRCLLAAGITVLVCFCMVMTENAFWYGIFVWLVIGFAALTKLSCRILCSKVQGLAPEDEKQQ